MTNKEAYQLIESCLEYDKDMSDNPEVYVEAIRLAKDVFDKQEPMKPYKYRTEGDMSRDVYDCGECGTVITLNDTYCRRCGRVQMWED